MADKYIKCEDAWQMVFSFCERCVKLNANGDCNNCEIDEIKEKLYDIPAADVRPVVHAHWEERDIGDGDVYYECSHCGEAWTLIDGTPKENNMVFCNRCGAVMDEDTREWEDE